jgi:hypothetical protein
LRPRAEGMAQVIEPSKQNAWIQPSVLEKKKKKNLFKFNASLGYITKQGKKITLKWIHFSVLQFT